MPSEQSSWSQIKPLLAGLDPIRVENSAGVGTPDVNYIDGWIELKYKKEWPHRESTPLRLDHFTQEQRNFLRRRSILNGNVHLLIKIGRSEYILFDGLTAAEFVGYEPKGSLIEKAVGYWKKKPSVREFQKALKR